MNKFKIGDKVKLRDDLEVGRDYGGITFLRDMKDLQDKELTIDRISRQGNYILKEGRYYYSEEMLEKVNDTDDLLEFALGKLNMTKEELRREYENSKTEKQIVEDGTVKCNGKYSEGGSTNWRVPNQRELSLMFLVDKEKIKNTYCRTKFSNPDFRKSWTYNGGVFTMDVSKWDATGSIRCIKVLK